jgi:hypothetical protein
MHKDMAIHMQPQHLAWQPVAQKLPVKSYMLEETTIC